jgi:hypothetical protein
MTQLALFPPVANNSVTGFVYIGTDGHKLKVGYSASPRRRGGELKLTMLWTFPGTVEDERRLHRLWARHRIGGSEWFQPAPEILEWLDERILHGTVARMALRMLVFRRNVAAGLTHH